MELAIQAWGDLPKLFNLLPKEKQEHLKYLEEIKSSKATISAAKEGCISWLLKQCGLDFIFAGQGQLHQVPRYAFDENPKPFLRDTFDNQYNLENSYRIKRIDEDGIKREFTPKARTWGIKSKLKDYPNGIPAEALRKLPKSMASEAVIFDLRDVSDPILAYPIKRRFFIYVAKSEFRLFGSDKMYEGFIPIDTPYYASIAEWE